MNTPSYFHYRKHQGKWAIFKPDDTLLVADLTHTQCNLISEALNDLNTKYDRALLELMAPDAY